MSIRMMWALLAVATALAQASPSWRLATGDTAVVIAVEQGRPTLNSLRAVRSERNWLATPLQETLMATVEIDGGPVKTDWKYQAADLDARKEQLTLRFTNAHPRLTLLSIWRARPGRGPVEHWLAIANESGRVVTVTHQDSLVLDGLALAPGESAQAWWINRGGSNASRQGGTFLVDTDGDFDQVLVSNPQDGSSPVPWMAIQVGKSHGLYVGWEFSGIGRIHGKSAARSRIDLRVGNVPEFKTDVPAGETFLVPPAFVGCYRGDIDEGAYTLHRFVLDKLLPPLPSTQPYPTLAYNLYLDAGGNKAKEADVLRSAALSKDLGFETFVPDAMWFAGVGDWRWDPKRFPHGVRPIEEYVHENGMKMGLWTAWNNAGISDYPGALNVFRHARWIIDRETSVDWKPAAFNGKRICLADDEAREWAQRETERLVSEYKLDYLEHDDYLIEIRCEHTNHRHKYGVDVSYWSALGYYQIQEKLKRDHPELVLEGCSNGGHMKDFGYIQRVHYIVTTDMLSSVTDRQSIWDSTFALPPAVLQAYTAENRYNKVSDRPRPYFWRCAMMSAWELQPTNTASWTAEEKVGARRATQVYKEWIRPMLRDVKVHHILPRPDDYHWDGMFYWSPSLKRGTVYIFRPNNDEQMKRVRLNGLVAAQRYKVRSEDGSVQAGIHSGAELMHAGLRIKLPGKFTSDLIYLEDAK